MKSVRFTSSFAALVALAVPACAFPAMSEDAAYFMARAAADRPSPPPEDKSIPFDPVKQLVDVEGKHAFVPPNFAAGDQRGPCPGLNSLANHNYLPHNGVAAWTEIAEATNKVFGLGPDIAGFLSVYGAIFDGNIFSLLPGYSIGGPTSLNKNVLNGGGILGSPQGLSGSHNKYESDASAARGDLYTSGDDYKVDINRFNALYALPKGVAGGYDLGVWAEHRKNMFLKSKHENPQFFYALFAGPIASTGGFTFPPRMMSNKSAEYPDNGVLTPSILKSFFSISGDDSNLKYTYGHERIPANFYRRAFGNEYTAAKFFQDTIMFASYFPEMFSIGGNTGKVDSYAALDLGNITGGVYNGADLLKGDNFKCFAFQSLLSIAPDFLKGGYSDPDKAMGTLLDAVNMMVGDASCPEIQDLQTSQFEKYPGAKVRGNNGGLLGIL